MWPPAFRFSLPSLFYGFVGRGLPDAPQIPPLPIGGRTLCAPTEAVGCRGDTLGRPCDRVSALL